MEQENNKSLKMKLGVTDVPINKDKVTAKPWIIGHRGALYDELENTIPAFQKCLDLGCEGIELDVFWLEEDNSLIVFHGGGTDQNPGDLTDYCIHQDGRSILDCKTYPQTQKLLFNPDWPEFGCPPERVRGATIPRLDEVFNLIKGTNIIVKIELKGEGCTLPVLDLVHKMDMLHQCHFSSFDHTRIALIRKLHPQRNPDGSHKYKTGALFDTVPSDFLQQAQAIGASEVHLRYDTCTKERVQQIHNAGMGTMAWLRGPVGMKRDCQEHYLDVGNEDFAMYETLMLTGVQQLCCNRPDVLRQYLKQFD
eukprot:CAMPEP_0202460602 /NCGR_PEP_ID=MMETSP1360-20130828/44914_1 /ASSEMBLY_ACC=CAM_ASM_000848 /TAXON_ID=515479 /ORGANISM="Licmophora paradoxa, Strain CCMP2313" /LENGTH=307 /DNA_ID=CAMNT_0049082329 /DNA_START=116 /DNA_END=1039 /DNA_ORIENTATION=-